MLAEASTTPDQRGTSWSAQRSSPVFESPHAVCGQQVVEEQKPEGKLGVGLPGESGASGSAKGEITKGGEACDQPVQHKAGDQEKACRAGYAWVRCPPSDEKQRPGNEADDSEPDLDPGR